MRTAALDYALPPALIAQEPVTPRDSSRLLVVHRKSAEHRFEHRHFADIGDYLQAGDLLVANDTRVIPARLWAQRPGGAGVELLLLRPVGEGWWEALARPARRLRAGTTLTLMGPTGDAGERGQPDEPGPTGSPDKKPDPRIEVGERTASGGVRLRPLAPLSEVLAHYGQVPLPPYIQRPLTDTGRYQTIYSERDGSAAAPTAGLHFTPQLLDQLRAKQVGLTFVTLHIGLDTFRPIRTETVEGHRMHAEHVEIAEETAAAVNAARAAGRRVIAVGTTAVRTMEAAAQAVAGGPPLATSPEEAATLAAAQSGVQTSPSSAKVDRGASPGLSATSGWTALYITPGHQFRVVDALITNFHLPRSTLLVLVSAFADHSLLFDAYQEAIRLRYRFFSFGDAMLIV
ncbi:MAG: tRNA preQ1(34) S-adenosylmethionine ribosyltransferase-isomerase QueA [Dehalococcoidia bacterium]|nr:tRNA preQ1(34) S-adenosylmethionine ribosyltransferase-isomerase QueA [Dehalococcoidia bacterium]